jgi:hypothetical protein
MSIDYKELLQIANERDEENEILIELLQKKVGFLRVMNILLTIFLGAFAVLYLIG